ncbi:MAG: hypothetical protein U9N14_03085 [Pseudomonadota bacterium]|nr:hypothetical protein [Pseudomonadota bacterium]
MKEHYLIQNQYGVGEIEPPPMEPAVFLPVWTNQRERDGYLFPNLLPRGSAPDPNLAPEPDGIEDMSGPSAMASNLLNANYELLSHVLDFMMPGYDDNPPATIPVRRFTP